MRTIAWCMLALSLMGCQSGPRWFMRDRDVGGRTQYETAPVSEPVPTPDMPPQPAQPPKDGPNLPVPQPAQKERTPYESSSRSRGWFGGRSNSQASRVKSSSRTTSTARKSTSPIPATKTAVADESVKQLMADLEKIKRDKTALETKLTEESAKQTQQRLELEARLALLQEQMRQQSALQQVMYQPQAPAMPRASYNGPAISSGTPSPSMQMPFSPSVQTYAPQAQSQAVPAWGNSVPTWGNSTSNWNAPATIQQQQVEQWPYSPQRR